MPPLGTVAKPLLLEFRNTWSRQLRALYVQMFSTKCPKSLHHLQTFTFLPKLLVFNLPWQTLEIQTVAAKCGIHYEYFFQSRALLAQQLNNSHEFSLLCTEVLRYRLEKTRLVYCFASDCYLECLSLSRSLALSLCRSLPLSLCRSVPLSLCRSLALSLCRSVSLSLCRSVALSLCCSVALWLCRSVALSPCRSESLSRSVALSLSRSLSLSLSSLLSPLS